MKNNFKAVMIDLDGTLLTDDKKITDFSNQILQKLYDNGIKIIIATGRGLSRAKQLTEKLDFDKIILANNGAIIHSSSNIATDEDLKLEYNVVDELSTLSEEYGIRPYFLWKTNAHFSSKMKMTRRILRIALGILVKS